MIITNNYNEWNEFLLADALVKFVTNSGSCAQQKKFFDLKVLSLRVWLRNQSVAFSP